MRGIPSVCLAAVAAALLLLPRSAAAQSQPDANALHSADRQFEERVWRAHRRARGEAAEAKAVEADAGPRRRRSRSRATSRHSGAKVLIRYRRDRQLLGTAGHINQPVTGVEIPNRKCHSGDVDPVYGADFYLASAKKGGAREGSRRDELPGSLQAKVGKMRAAFAGQHAAYARDAWGDRPLVIKMVRERHSDAACRWID